MIKLHRVGAYVLRHVYEIGGSLDRKIDIFFWPTIDLLTFGLLTVYIDRLDVRVGLAGAIIGALILWTLVYNIQRDIAVSLLEEAWTRNLYNLFATPLRISEVVVGTLLLSFGKATVSIAFITALASWLFHFNLLSLGAAIAFYIFNVFVFGWAFGYMTAALIFRFGTRIQTVAWSLIALIYPISGVFYPLATLPPWLASVARAFPLAYVFEGLRAFLLGQSIRSSDFVIIIVLNVIYLVAGIWLFVVGFKNAKNRGWFIHPS